MKRFVLISCLCCAAAAYAVTDNRPVTNTQPTAKLEMKLKQPDIKPWTPEDNSPGNASIMKMKLAKAEATQEQLTTGKMQLLSQEGLRKLAADGKKQRLDSVKCSMESTGENISLQTFKFDERSLPETRINSLWDARSNTWTEVERYGYVWDEDEYCLSQWARSDLYNSGSRYDYTYDDKKQGISQIFYTYDSGNYIPLQKGEYVYDNEGRIIEEVLSSYADGQWIKAAMAKVSYDAEGRQASFENYEWNGIEWVPAGTKQEYAYDKNGNCILFYYLSWNASTKEWENFQQIVQEFDEDNHLLLQENKFWNTTTQSWVGVQNINGNISYNLKNVFTYDDKGRKTYESTSQIFDPYEDYVKIGDMTYVYGPADENGVVEMDAEEYFYSEVDGTPEKVAILKERYDKEGRTIFSTEQLYNNGKWMYDYEKAYTYDEKGNYLTGKYWMFSQDDENKKLAQTSEEYIYDEHNNIVDSYYMNGQGTSEDDWVYATRFTYAFEQDTVRVDKLGYRWDGSDFVPNWGEGVRYDFSQPIEEIQVWPGVNSYHKITETISYLSNGANWDKQVFKYYYSDLNTTGINGVTADNSDTKVELSLNGDVLSVKKDAAARVNIYSAQGARMLSTTAETVSISSLNPGLYIVEVNGKATKFVKR